MHCLLVHDTTPTPRLARHSNPRRAQTTRRDAERDAHTRQPASTCTAHTSRRTSHISPTNTHSERLLAPTRRCARALQKRHARACATPCWLRCRALAARHAAADARGQPPQPSCHRGTIDDRRAAIAPSPFADCNHLHFFFFCGGHTELALFFSYFLFGTCSPRAGRLPLLAPMRRSPTRPSPPASAHYRKTPVQHCRKA